MSTYLKQTDIKSRQDLIKFAINYFWQLVNSKQSKGHARELVRRRTGVVI